MAAIKTGFDNVPAETEKGARAAYAMLYADLDRLALRKPATTSEEITRDDLVAHLRAVAGELVAGYIASGPKALDGATTDEDVAARLSANIGAAWGPLPYAPNAITAADVSAARLMG